MSIPLIDALRMADPEPGVYRERMNGKTIVVQVIAETDDEPTPELAEQVMLSPWVWFPDPPGGFSVRANPGSIDLPGPITFDETDLTPGDLPEPELG